MLSQKSGFGLPKETSPPSYSQPSPDLATPGNLVTPSSFARDASQLESFGLLKIGAQLKSEKPASSAKEGGTALSLNEETFKLKYEQIMKQSSHLKALSRTSNLALPKNSSVDQLAPTTTWVQEHDPQQQKYEAFLKVLPVSLLLTSLAPPVQTRIRVLAWLEACLSLIYD